MPNRATSSAVVFFFSSRRRHTRCSRDWSSDVCSSDLGGLPRGFGMIDADGTLHGVGTLLPSSMLPGRAPEGRALVTAICGGARHPEQIGRASCRERV